MTCSSEWSRNKLQATSSWFYIYRLITARQLFEGFVKNINIFLWNQGKLCRARVQPWGIFLYSLHHWIFGSLLNGTHKPLPTNMWCDLAGSVKLAHVTFSQFSIWLKCSLGEVHFGETPTWISPVVPRYEQLKGSQNKRNNRNSFLFLAISQSIQPTSD